MEEGALLWTPSAERIEQSNLQHFCDWLRERGLEFRDYHSLWRWSVTQEEDFWRAVWDYFGPVADRPPERLFIGEGIGRRQWLPDTGVNLAENILRHAVTHPEDPAIHYCSEINSGQVITWRALARDAMAFATSLRRIGILPGDRIVGYVTNRPEAIVAMLGAIAIGALWSAVSPEFGVPATTDRFEQIEPRLIVAVDTYHFGGRDHDRSAELDAIIDALPSLQHIVLLSQAPSSVSTGREVHSWQEMIAPAPPPDFEFTRVGGGHPLWVVFSSGTTGLPKAIVHGHAEILLEQLKAQYFHADLRPGKTIFFYASTGWVVWNSLVCCLLSGCTIVSFEGAPLHPDCNTIWRVAEQTKCTALGLSPGLIRLMEQANLEPKRNHDLSALEAVMLSGSQAPPEAYEWIYQHVEADLWVFSHAGSTELPAGFAGGIPIERVRAGEIQGPLLGMHVDCLDDAGKSVTNQVGELVIRNACPSMPLGLWNDPHQDRLTDTYMSDFPGLWRQGDLFKQWPDGRCCIYGRSDAVLNRNGIRIGSGEIYRTVDRIPEICDAIVVSVSRTRGAEDLVLFVVMEETAPLNPEMVCRIKDLIRRYNSPRHVPDHIVQAEKIPYGLTGKKLEIPLRRILDGTPVSEVIKPGSLSDPSAIDWYIAYAADEAAVS